MLRRRAPVVLVVVGFVLLVAWNLVFTQRVLEQIKESERRQTILLSRTLVALADTAPGVSTAALADVVATMRQSNVPMIVTGPDGVVEDTVNLPFSTPLDGARMREYIAVLATNNPVDVVGGGRVYYGNSQLVRALRTIPWLQAGVLGALVFAGIYALVIRGRAEREHVWAGMARESAHQLGTPLSSLSGWIALLEDEVEEQGKRASPMLKSAAENMKADLERLERVAHRFERIGREPKRDEVDVATIVDRIVAYFRKRVPSRAAAVRVVAHRPADPLIVLGDAVLIEWVLEALVKNAVDALAGRGGTIDVSAERAADGSVRLRVADDGPGIPRELRRRIFDAGFSTKARGWGIGLSLARRIVQESHGGKLALVPSDRGATFDVILP